MSVITFRISDELETELKELIEESGKTKSAVVIEAIKTYLEDRKDYRKARQILRKIEAGEIGVRPLEELVKKYGL